MSSNNGFPNMANKVTMFQHNGLKSGMHNSDIDGNGSVFSGSEDTPQNNMDF